MTFSTSVTPDISESLPMALTGGGIRGQQFSTDHRFDVIVNGLAFVLKPGPSHPYLREGVQVRKEQLDTSTEAGEQTLGDWWTRSISSWHMGAGIRWYEPGAESETANRFARSQGVNPWEQGQVTLLHDVATAASGLDANVTISTFRRAGVDGYVVVSNSAVQFRNGSNAVVLSGTLGGVNGTQPAVNGRYVWVGHDSGVSRWDTNGTGAMTTPLTGTGSHRVWWVKARLFIARANILYWCAPTATGAISTAATKLYEHPDPDWIWTDVTETPDSVLLAGYSGSESVVYAATAEDDGSALPTLGAPRQVLKMPPAEQIMSMGTYLGSFAVLGTTAGVRVAQVGQNGQLLYGPLTIESKTPVRDVTFADRFAYVPLSQGLPDGTTGLARIDLSAPVGDTGLFAWAFDVSSKAALNANAVALVGNTNRALLAAGGVVYAESATALVDEGWIELGRIRYRTAELKDFQRLRVNGDLNNGVIVVAATTSLTDVESKVITYSAGTGLDSEGELILPGNNLAEWVSLRVYLRRSAAHESPALTGVVVKALPAVQKARMMRYPLGCFDFEITRSGERLGYEGFSWDRLLELEALERAGASVVVSDLRTGEVFQATIDSVQFSGEMAPDRQLSNTGGIIDLTVRARL